MSTPSTNTIDNSYDWVIDKITTATGLPVYRQGSLSGSYPITDFITIWESYAYSSSKYDNDYKSIKRMYNICSYSKSPNNAFSNINTIYTALTGKSKCPSRDIMTDFSEWYGRGVTVYVDDRF